MAQNIIEYRSIWLLINEAKEHYYEGNYDRALSVSEKAIQKLIDIWVSTRDEYYILAEKYQKLSKTQIEEKIKSWHLPNCKYYISKYFDNSVKQFSSDEIQTVKTYLSLPQFDWENINLKTNKEWNTIIMEIVIFIFITSFSWNIPEAIMEVLHKIYMKVILNYDFDVNAKNNAGDSFLSMSIKLWNANGICSSINLWLVSDLLNVRFDVDTTCYKLNEWNNYRELAYWVWQDMIWKAIESYNRELYIDDTKCSSEEL